MPGMPCTYWSSKHRWAWLRIRAITAEKASWSILSCIWGKNTFPPRITWRTNSVLAAVSAEGCWTQGNVIVFSLFLVLSVCGSLLSTDLKLQRMQVKHKLTTFFGFYSHSLSLKPLLKCIQNFTYFHSVYPILFILCLIHSSNLKHTFFFTIKFQLKSA